jgi:hypothetical protein
MNKKPAPTTGISGGTTGEAGMDNCRVSKEKRKRIRQSACDLFNIEINNPNFLRETIGLDSFKGIFPEVDGMGLRRATMNAEFDEKLRSVLFFSATGDRPEDWELVGAIIGMKGEFAGGEIPLALLHLIRQQDWLGVGLFVKERINETYEDIVRRVERSCE